MLCENPILAVKKPKETKLYFLNAKEIECIENNKISFVDLLGEKAVHPSLLESQSYLKSKIIGTYPVVKFPCSKCIVCLYERFMEWTVRCWLEAKEYDCNQFITLTYDDKHLPKTGVDKKEMSKFMHDLRQHFQRKHNNHVGIRFFCCGEYGECGNRPHYHILLFNCPPFGDEKEHSKNPIGQSLYNSETQENIWKKGKCIIGAVTKKSISYVTRYALKNHNLKLPAHLNPEFINMSRNKGIGIAYFNENIEDLIKHDEIFFSGRKKVKLPHYFNKKLKDYIGAEQYEKDFVRLRAKKAKSLLEAKMAITGLTEKEIYNQRRECIKNWVKQLERNFDDSS